MELLTNTKTNIMTKKDLIKRILELGIELEKASGVSALMIIDDMEIEVDNYTKQLNGHQECRTCGKKKEF